MVSAIDLLSKKILNKILNLYLRNKNMLWRAMIICPKEADTWRLKKIVLDEELSAFNFLIIIYFILNSIVLSQISLSY